MANIDELEGAELAKTVALEVGYIEGEDMWGGEDGTVFVVDVTPPGEFSVYANHETVEYRPDRNIAQAWELDGEEWAWRFHEGLHYFASHGRHGMNRRGLLVFCRADDISHSALVAWADFPTKPEAYATARCRAYLKAKAVT